MPAVLSICCPACDKTDDHYHQYLNVKSNVVDGYMIEGQFFFKLNEATDRIKELYECDYMEALTYVNSMRKAYN